jgi:PEP-CTERM motif-containing protein
MKTAECAVRSLKAIAASAALGFALGSALPAMAANLITNGGFEAGSFAGWTQVGNTASNGVQCPGPSPTVLQGNCSAFFGPTGSTGGITQNVNLVAGTDYVLNFSYLPDGGNPSSIAVALSGTSYTLSRTNPAFSTGFINVQAFITPTTSGVGALSFNFRDDPGFMFLDAVSFAAPEPGSLALLGLGLAGIAAQRRRRA